MTALDLRERMPSSPGSSTPSNPDATRLERFDLPLGYDAEHDAKSWAATLQLFRDALGRD